MALFNRKKKEPQVLTESIGYQTNPMMRLTDYNGFKGSRKELRDMYDLMGYDAVVSAALDSWASDSTQVDLSRQHSVWIEGPNPALNQELEDFLYNVVGIEDKVYSYAYQIAKYGEMYIDTHMYDEQDLKPNEDLKNNWFFEIYPRPQDVFRLFSHGRLDGFYVTDSTGKDTVKKEGVIFPETQFIPFVSDFVSPSEEIKLNLVDGEGKTKEVTYKTITGSSFLRGSIMSWQVLRIIEDVIMLTRVAKSSVYRVVKVELGNLSRKESDETMDNIKKIFSTRETINLMDGAYRSFNDPVAAQENIYTPTRNGVGGIEITTIGGDYDLKTALDLDYFRNKFMASLMTPKAYLGFDGEASSVLGDNSLARLDEKYARRCKRLQSAVRNGLVKMCDFYLKMTGRDLDTVPEYKVCMAPINSNEERVAREEFASKIEAASSLTSLAISNFANQVDRESLFDVVFNNVLGMNASELKIDKKPDKVKNYGGRGSGYGSGGRFVTLSRNDVVDVVNDFESVSQADIFLDVNGKQVPLTEAVFLYSDESKKLLSEATYKQLKSRVQMTDPERVKKAGKLITTYMGLNKNGDVLFKTTSGTTPGKFWYQTVRLLDLPKAIEAFRNDPDITDRDIVKYSIEGDISVYCNDPSFLYWGWQYMADKNGYGIVPEKRPPVVRNPQQRGAICKHCYTVLKVLPFWTNRIVKDLRMQYFRTRPSGTKAPSKVENPAAKDVKWKNNEED